MEHITCPGFKVSGIFAGIKKKPGVLDLGLIASDTPMAVAGIFTRSLVKAAPVLLDMARITSGTCRAVVVNSGNANCCNGESGMASARDTTRCVAEEMGIGEEEVLVSSTGVIGEPLPVEKVTGAVPGLVQRLSEKGFFDFARAIMTTDTVPKAISKKAEINGRTVTVTGVAKGVGMIHPNMATMLAYLCTDAEADAETLKKVLTKAADQSFNRITVDGDTSTNDTVLLLASGVSGANVENEADQAVFQSLVNDVSMGLARMLIKDGEGATKLVTVSVSGAESNADALAVARTVAGSNLVKTAFFGEDANWGRIIGAVGRAGVPVIQDKIDIFFDDVMMVKDGMGCGKEIEKKATTVLKQPEFTVGIRLNMGGGAADMLTCDFSYDYVKINADYRS